MSLESRLAKLAVHTPDLEALKAAEAGLKSNPESAQHTRAKISALIKLERYQGALDFLGARQAQFPEAAAYILYKLGKIHELRQLAASNPSTGVELSLAQAEFRIGNFGAAEHILSRVNLQDSDLATNIQAVRASGGLDVEGTSFEAVFAKAYSLLYRDPKAALEVLSEAKQLASDEYDVQSVLLQAASATFLAGNHEEAVALLQHSTDPALDQIRRINLLAMQQPPQSAEHAQLLLKSHFESPLENATAPQESAFIFNKLLLERTAGRRIGSVANAHVKQYPASLAPSVLALQSQGPKKLRKLLARDPTNVAIALALVSSVPTEQGAQIIVQLCAALVASGGTITPGLAGLLVAANKFRGTPQDTVPVLRLVPLKDATTARYLGLSDLEADVAKVRAYFEKECDDAIQKQAGLLLTSPATFEAQGVPTIDTLTASIDVEALDKLGMAPFAKKRHVVQHSSKKRSGKPKLPKDYDEAKQPDPERWLAKMDRSTYKRKKGKGGASQGAAQGAQGASQGVAASAPSPGPVISSVKKNKKKKGRK